MEHEVWRFAHPLVDELLSFPHRGYCFDFVRRAGGAFDPDRLMGDAKGIQ